MAQTQPAASSNGTSKAGRSAATGGPDSQQPRTSLFPFRLPRRSLVDRSPAATPTRIGAKPAASQPATAARPGRSGLSRMLFGMLVLMIGFYVISFLLALLVGHLSLSAQSALTRPLASGKVFLLGGLNWYTILTLALLVALYVVLLRYNVIPRDPFGARQRAQDRVAAPRTGTGATHGAAATVNLAPQARASRRQAATTAATTATAAAENGKRGKTTAKVPTPSPAKAKAGQSGAKTAQSAVRATPEPPAARSGAHDAEYERVKALQRQQRRREAKR